ncbi:hypothetical protein A2442_03725 [Candidatus Campbellbacteria bacterium RIFOXYC2_FULL_35_25]|uniref:Bile acid:sodium symporter n=1 Tax=Candidatus Campbellbacteria bacterium RIFOXYC2_FULL_35_25 TaxID=1797582 RepID=A0A1F5EJU2_9BACT|nr:MAG: hypothetical protein A2442_03725 [Candidatus Campbellbacteria bacterium RIFOXYC2_FULL_35_25]
MKSLKTIRYVTESHYLIIGLAFIVGLLFSEGILWASVYTKLILATIFFLSSIKIDLKEVKDYLNDKLLIAFLSVASLFILPIVVYYITNLLYPSLAVAFLILSAVPVGMTAPLLSEIIGGKYGLTLVLTVVTSLLAPVTLPFILNFLAGASVSIDALGMFILLAKVIYAPFILAQILKRFWQKKIDKISVSFKPLSVLLLGALIAIIVAKQSHVIIEGFDLLYISLLFLFFLVLHFVGYFIVFWKSKSEKIAVAICFTYMNFTLAIELVNEFFSEPEIIVPVVLSIVPWTIIFIPFKHISQKL